MIMFDFEFGDEQRYDSSIPSDLVANKDLFQRAAMLNLKYLNKAKDTRTHSSALGVGKTVVLESYSDQEPDFMALAAVLDAPAPPAFF